jgi:hypothetical protein
MQLFMKKIHFKQRASWKLHGRNSPTWAFFFNDESKVDVKVSQIMCFVLVML